MIEVVNIDNKNKKLFFCFVLFSLIRNFAAEILAQRDLFSHGGTGFLFSRRAAEGAEDGAEFIYFEFMGELRELLKHSKTK